MIKERKKKGRSMKIKLLLRKKWEKDKLKMKIRGRNKKRKDKINLIIFWLRKLNKKSSKKANNNVWENNAISKDSSRQWWKTNKINVVWRNKLRDKDLRYIYFYSGYQSTRVIYQITRRVGEKTRVIEKRTRGKNQKSDGFLRRLSHQGSEGTNQSWGWENVETYQ